MEHKKEPDQYYNWFREYVSSFYGKDDLINRNIKIKEDHTLRVVQNIKELCSSINANKETFELSILIALFHDIGRFEQFSSYGTFNDKDSEDHAGLGVQVLKDQNILNSLSDHKIHLILNAILLHNKKDLYTESEDKDLILLSKLIRDADKLDILKVLTGEYLKPEKPVNPALSLGLPEKTDLSKYAVDKFFNNKPLNNKKIENQQDFKLLLISWIYDLNFDQTLKIILKKKYIESLFSVLPQNDLLEKIKIHTFRHIKGKCRLL